MLRPLNLNLGTYLLDQQPEIFFLSRSLFVSLAFMLLIFLPYSIILYYIIYYIKTLETTSLLDTFLLNLNSIIYYTMTHSKTRLNPVLSADPLSIMCLCFFVPARYGSNEISVHNYAFFFLIQFIFCKRLMQHPHFSPLHFTLCALP